MRLFSKKKNGKTKWNCGMCQQEIEVMEIGAVFKGGQLIIPEDGNCEDIASAEDFVFCEKCSLKSAPFMKFNEARDEKRPLTVDELITCQEQLRSDDRNEANRRIKQRKELPKNSVLFDAINFDSEGRITFWFSCPKCSEKISHDAPNANVRTPEQQMEYYDRLPEKLPYVCPSCYNKFDIWK